MKRFILCSFMILSLTLLVSCSSQNTDNIQFNGNNNYDIVGKIIKIDKERNEYLIKLDKHLQEGESEIWIMIDKNTTFKDKKGNNINPNSTNVNQKVKATILGNTCIDTDPRKCPVKMVVIE